MVRGYDLGRYAAPALRAARLVRQGLPDDSQRRAVGSDFLNNPVGSCQPLPRPGIWRGLGLGTASLAHLGSGELVTGPDIHVINRIRWPQRVTCDTSRMSALPGMSTEDVTDQPIRAQFEVFLDEHRSHLNGCLDGLTEDQARRSLVASRTTLLGLVKHATFVEKVWFDEAVTGRSRAQIGIPASPDESFILHDTDTIATVRQAHREACEASRRAGSSLGLDDIVRGNRRGALPLRWVYLHLLRELAQHCGHADILREQVLSE